MKISRPALAKNQKLKTLSGLVVALGEDEWVYRDALSTVNISFNLLKKLLSTGLLHSYKAVLTWYVQNTSPKHLIGVHAAFVKLAQSANQGKNKIVRLKSVDLLNFRSNSSKTELARLRPLFRRWNAMGYSGAEEVAATFKVLRIGGDNKGIHVLRMDPYLGPFSEVELNGIHSALDQAYAEERISEETYLLTWLYLALGARTVQFAAMKVCDVIRKEEPNGHVSFFVRVPRAKQLQSRPRTTFKTRPLIREIGEPLYEFAQRVQASFEGQLVDPSLAPLFPAQHPQDQWHEEFRFHRTASALTNSVVLALKELKITSERTGRPLNITPVRFRRTLGTRAAQEGHSEYVIAELLDHSDTQNVHVYVASIPEIAERIDSAVAHQLAPLARAFMGEVIRNESEAVRAGDTTSRIIDLRVDQSGHPMGSCGQFGECRFLAPIACYTCRKFQPWIDGPHKEVLNYLLDRRERVFAKDKRIASIHDRTILAIAEVIQICTKLQEASAG